MDAKIRLAAELLRSAKYAIALTGAGISTPSGIPDFRSPVSGLWNNVNPFEVASIFGFQANPKMFYDWIRPLARTVLDAQPNPAHWALSRLERAGRLKGVITQNIDMLHTRAGSQVVHEVHGHFRQATCLRCGSVFELGVYLPEFLDSGAVPRCKNCGGILKPNVILFGEQLPRDVFDAAERAVRRCDVMLVVGSSLEVAPVSDFPHEAARRRASLIIVNYDETPADRTARVVIRDDVAKALPQIADAVLEAEADLG